MCVRRDVAPQPVEVACLGLGTGHDQIGGLAQSRNGQVGLDPALVVEPLGIDHLARRDVDIVGADMVEHRAGVTSLQPEFGEGRLVEQRHTAAHGGALSGAIGEPVLAAIAIFVAGRATRLRVPVGALPAECLAMAGTRRDQPVMDRRPADAARGLILLERIVRCVEQPQAFAHPIAQVTAVDLEGHVAANIDGPQIRRRHAVAHPFGHHLADAARRLQPDRIETGGNETPFKLRYLPDMVAHVRREAFRTAEEFLQAGPFQRRHAAHRVYQQRLEMRKVAGDLVEAEIVRNAVHPPGAGIGLEGADQQLAGILLVIAAMVVIAEHGKVGGQPGHILEQDIIMLTGVQGDGDADRCGQIARPHAARQHDIVRVDRAVFGIDAGHTAAVVADARHLALLEYLRAAGLCPFG